MAAAEAPSRDSSMIARDSRRTHQRLLVPPSRRWDPLLHQQPTQLLAALLLPPHVVLGELEQVQPSRNGTGSIFSAGQQVAVAEKPKSPPGQSPGHGAGCWLAQSVYLRWRLRPWPITAVSDEVGCGVGLSMSTASFIFLSEA